MMVNSLHQKETKRNTIKSIKKMYFQKIFYLIAIFVALMAIAWITVKLTFFGEQTINILAPMEGYNYVFDYVVVGAGTAGTVVAALLAKHTNATVLLVEAGDRFGYLSSIPLLTTFQQKGLNDWAFLSVPQRHSSKGLEEQRQCLPRGKGLGGSAQINYMLHFDGSPNDFNAWSNQYNLSEWSWEAVKPFLEAARAKPYELYEIEPFHSKLTEALSLAEVEFSHKQWSFRRARYNIKNGLRHSVYHRFLQNEAHNNNFRIMTNTLAKRIELIQDEDNVNDNMVSLQVGAKDDLSEQKEHIFNIDIRKELILSAGAYQTPQLLLASGIGDSHLLQSLRIPLQKHLPEVGKNLHDHLNMPLYVSIDVIGPTLNQRALLNPFSLLSYLFTGGGHLGTFGVLGHIDGAPADNFGLLLFAAGAIDETTLMSISNFKRSNFRALFPRYHNLSQEGFVLISTCFQPVSRGTVSIRNANMRKNPLIDPNYLSANEDVSCMINAIRAAVQIITSDSFSSLRPHIHWPKLMECSNFGPFERDFRSNTPSDRYLECLLRHVGLGSHHPGGSCKMGTHPENSVVDEKFRVHGLKNVRIIDASVLPTPISGSPNSIIAGMAVRGATLIIKEELKGKQY